MNISPKEAENFEVEVALLDMIVDRIDRKMSVNREAGDNQSYHVAQSLLTDAILRLRIPPNAPYTNSSR